MTYREQITELFKLSQSLLTEYSALCLKLQESHAADHSLLQECDKKFREYNKVIREHHELILQVTRRKVKLDQTVVEVDPSPLRKIER